MVELRNCLEEHEESLQKIEMIPPAFQNKFSEYLTQFGQWILEWTDRLAKGQQRS